MKFNNIIHSFFSSFCVLASSFFTGVVIARGLDVLERGVLAEYYLFVNIIIPFSLFGIYDILIVNKSNNYWNLRSLVKSSSIFVIIGSIAYVTFAIRSNYSYWIVLTGVLTILCNFLVITNQGILARNGNIKQSNTFRLVVPMVYFFFCLLSFTFSNLTVEKIASYNAVANVFVALSSTYILQGIRKKMPESDKKGEKLGYNYYFSKISDIKWIALSAIFFSFSTKIDQLFISQFIGYEQLAYYAVAISSSIVIVNFFSTSVLSVVYPKLSNLKHVEVLRHGLVITFATTVIYLIIAVIMCFLYPILIPLIFGEKYGSSIVLCQLMIINGAGTYLKQLLNKKLKLLGNNKESFFSELLPSILFVALFLVLFSSDFYISSLNIVIMLFISNLLSLIYPALIIIRKLIKHKVALKDLSFLKTWYMIK